MSLLGKWRTKHHHPQPHPHKASRVGGLLAGVMSFTAYRLKNGQHNCWASHFKCFFLFNKQINKKITFFCFSLQTGIQNFYGIVVHLLLVRSAWVYLAGIPVPGGAIFLGTFGGFPAFGWLWSIIGSAAWPTWWLCCGGRLSGCHPVLLGDHHIRHVPFQLGCSLAWQACSGGVDCPQLHTSHQCVGAACHLSGPQVLLTTPAG